MNRFSKIFTFAVLAATTLFTACKKEETIDPNEKGTVLLEFDNVLGNQNLVLNSATYKNGNGDDYTVSMFNYFVSNVKLLKADGTEYAIPQEESYFLIKESDVASQKITLKNVPAGDYNGVKFIIGVDSLRNTMDISKRTGVLDPATGGAGMYWSWNSGYIFVKMEGTSPQAPIDSASNSRKYRMHIGGYGGISSKTINNIKETALKVADVAKVRANTTPTMHIVTDAAKVLSGGTNINLATNATTMFNPFSVNVANNYSTMFKLDHVHN
jgi:hypothetical protein